MRQGHNLSMNYLNDSEEDNKGSEVRIVAFGFLQGGFYRGFFVSWGFF